MADLRAGDGIVGTEAAPGDKHSALNGREYFGDTASGLTAEEEFVASVDNTVWDFTVACGSCHVGGGLAMEGKELPDGTVLRHSQRPTPTVINAYDYTVAEYWMGPEDQAANPGDAQYFNGAPAHYVNDQGMNNHLNSDGTLATTKLPGFAPQLAPWKYPYPIDMNGNGVEEPAMGDNFSFMMPNVHEMDCLFCHMEGYNNVVSSVAVQMGALNAAPAMGAGLLNMFTQAYIPGVVETMTVAGPMGDMDVAYLPGSTVSRIKGNPPSDNCRLCHSPKTMENFSDMFDQFLSSSPMEFNPNSPFAGLTGMAMPGYDLNAAFVPQTAPQSPTVYATTPAGGPWVYADGSDAGGPFEGMFPMALFQTYKNVTPLNQMAYEMGGNNQPGSGPIYFAGGGTYDQGALKKATIPFPRADFFKRGDLWDNNSGEVHYSFDCAGCHMDTNATNKDQCDPGRGFARLGGVESGAKSAGIDSRNSVKRCENCHITGQNNEGIAIETFGAPNPTAKHTAAGLTAMITTAEYADGPGVGNHLDVIDCSVCHMKKQSMAVRALDCLSGNRYPTMIGFQDYKGMMAMFTDPMGVKDMSDADVLAMTGMPKDMLVNQMVEWQPLRGWAPNGPKTLADGSLNPAYRNRIININMITAILWDNNGDFDANGDEATGVEADAMMTNGGLGFDPWIQRDLKAGMTFADTGFAVVPIGFGDPMDPTNAYGSVYSSQTANGFNPNSAWNYVGVYGGNIIFDTPEQINAYQAFRTAMNPAKPWEQTTMTIFGGPFQVTHNVVDTDIAVLGKSCNDCHDANSEFFSGGYDMTGTAVPTADLVDMDGDGTAETDLSAYNMMQRPLVDYEITADPSDLVTGAEAISKDGVVEEVEFEEHGCWDGSTFTLEGVGTCTAATHVRTKDLSRADFLYFDEGDETAIEAKVAALEANRTLADYVSPATAVIDASVPASVEVGATINLVADTTGNDASASYSWICNDIAGEVLEGATVAKTFSKTGTWTLTLKVTNAAGEVAQVAKQIQVTAPAPAADIAITSPQPAGTTNTVTFSNLPTHTMLYIIWGDGTRERVYDASASVDVDHLFRMYSKYFDGTNFNYRTTVYVYNGSSRVDVKREILTIAP